MGTTLQKTVADDPSSTSEEVVEVDLTEFEQAERDPRVKRVLAKARAYGAALEREGHNR